MPVLLPSENRMSTSNQTARPDASIVPIEGPAQTPSIADDFRTAGTASDALAARPAHLPSSFSSAHFGANNEQLPERLQSALRRIVQTIRNRIRIHAPPGNSPHQAGASILGRPAIPLVERARPELASPVRTKTHGRVFDRGPAALRIRHQYLPGLRPLDRQRAFAGRAARPLFPLVRASRRRCLRRESRHRSGAAHRTQQSHRKFNRRRSVQSLDRRQSRRIRPLRG